MSRPQLHAVTDPDPVPALTDYAYSELDVAEQLERYHAMVKNTEQQLMDARANLKVQTRLINSPISEQRKNVAKRAQAAFQSQVQDHTIALEVLHEEIAALEAQQPLTEETEVGDGEG